MNTYTIIITSPESEKDFAEFLNQHQDIEAMPKPATEYDPAIYDKEGNFQEIDLHLSGLPVSNDYLDWYFNKCDSENSNKNDISLEDFKIQMKSHIKVKSSC